MRLGVLFVATPGPLGGSNASLLSLLRALEGQVGRIVAAPEGAFLQEVRRRGAAESIITMGRRGSLRRRHLVLWSLLLCARAFKYRRQLDVVHANATNGMRVAAPTSRLLRLPTVVWVHDSSASRLDRATASLYRWLVYRPDFHAVSHVAEGVVRRLGFRADLVSESHVPNPLEPERVVGISRTSNGPVRVLYLGPARPTKGFDVAVEAVAHVRHLPVQWLFCTYREVTGWNRPFWTQLDREDSDYVRILEPRIDVASIYAQSDIVFVPSRQESFGRVAAEAMANGLPVVASDIPAFREVVGQDRAGILFDSGDPDAAADAVESLVCNEKRRRALGSEGLRRSSQYAPALIASQMLRAYEDSARQSRQRL